MDSLMPEGQTEYFSELVSAAQQDAERIAGSSIPWPKCNHDFHPLITRQYWLNVGDGLGPGYAVHAEHHTEHKVTKVYCRHCLEVRELNGES